MAVSRLSSLKADSLSTQAQLPALGQVSGTGESVVFAIKTTLTRGQGCYALVCSDGHPRTSDRYLRVPTGRRRSKSLRLVLVVHIVCDADSLRSKWTRSNTGGPIPFHTILGTEPGVNQSPRDGRQ